MTTKWDSSDPDYKNISRYPVCDSVLGMQKIFRRRCQGHPKYGNSVAKIKAILSKLLALVMLPFVLILAIIADILGIAIAEK